MPHVFSSFPHQGLNPCPLQWNYKGLTTGLPGKSKIGILKKINWFNHFIKDILKFPLSVVGRMQLPPVQVKVPAAVFHHCPCIISVKVSIVKKASSMLILSWNSSDRTDSLRRSPGPAGVYGPQLKKPCSSLFFYRDVRAHPLLLAALVPVTEQEEHSPQQVAIALPYYLPRYWASGLAWLSLRASVGPAHSNQPSVSDH